ncbi:transcription regulator gal80 [Pleurotus ostreatus]|uniref:Transcription regulator gal80 n=1 Tax=Pleurotus ostreatus TaxID=5322 RepID=A0A8H7A5S3_PLEOS|nr:transcription regulator gal80 [Pleurotus ostreatus]KAF7441309.1 transcription regulator gal80 [Pleurotus ostreatus]
MAQIRVGFIGLSASGWAATALFPSLQAPSVRPSFVVTALCTSSAASAAALYAAQIGSPITPYHGPHGAAQLAHDPRVDLVVVAVKAPAHSDAGKDVFVEWPAGAAREETVKMEERARAQGVRVMVGLQGRYSATAKVIKDTIASGKLGKVLSSTVMGSMSRDNLYWGPQISEGSAYIYQPRSGASFSEIILGHQLDTFTHVLGDFASVSATSTIAYPSATVVDSTSTSTPPATVRVTAPDHIALTGLLASGALVSMVYRAGYAPTPGRTTFLWEIDCERGSIRVEAPPPTGPRSHLMNICDMPVYVCGERVEFDGAGLVGNLAAGWVGYAEEKRGEGQGGYVTIGEAVKNRRLLDAIEESAREGKTVHL